MPLRAAASAVTCAANGVDLREPLKPAPPADSHAITLPSLSVSDDDRVVEARLDVGLAEGHVLAYPPAAARPSLVSAAPSEGQCFLIFFLPPPTAEPRFGPLRERALVFVRCPLRGQAAPVAQARVGADLHQALDVLRALAPQIALDGRSSSIASRSLRTSSSVRSLT